MLTPALEAAALTLSFGVAGALDPLGWTTLAIAFVLLQLHGGIGRRLSPSLGEELPLAVAAVSAAGIAGSALTGFGLETGRIAQSAAIGAGGVVLARAIGYDAVRRLRRAGKGLQNTLVLGGGPVAAEIAETLARSPDYGLQPVGFVDERNGRDLPLPYLGSFHDLPAIVVEHEATRLIVAFGPMREEDLVDVLRTWDEMPVDIYLVPRLFELGVGTDGNADEINGIPIVKLHRAPMRGPGQRAKRALDMVAAAVGLIITSPLLLGIAVAVRVSSPGPVFFRQRRIGHRGKMIEILKFRTMLVNDDSDTTWTVNGDARQTPIGRALRATHLDELPQLISVLKGDMSLVGPRPERPYYVDLFAAEIPRYKDRHRMPVGLTGWAQIHGLNGDTSIHDRTRFDNRYIERWSLWRDLVILTRTGRAIFTGVSQARRADKAAASQPAPNARVINLTDADLPSVSRNGHAIGNGNGNGAAVVHLDQIAENGHAKAPAPDGSTSTQ
ncbi:MAG: exopolysaccharide biosynthesis polyprenyl glycosylphosphotransferase [Actinomycetota bacterium]